MILVNAGNDSTLLDPVAVQFGLLQSFTKFCTAGSVTAAPPLTVMLPPSKVVTAGKLFVTPKMVVCPASVVSWLKFAATPLSVMPPNCCICAVGSKPPGLSVTPTSGPPVNCGTNTEPPFWATKERR